MALIWKKKGLFLTHFSHFLVTRESYKNSFSTYLTHIHTSILLTLLTFFFFFCLTNFEKKKKVRIYHWQVWFSLNVKRVKWLLFKRVKSVKHTLIEWKSPSKRVKIIPKRVKIVPKRVKITPKEWISLFGGGLLRDSSFVSSCPSMSSPKTCNSLFWSDFHSLLSYFHSLWKDFHAFWGWFSLD